MTQASSVKEQQPHASGASMALDLHFGSTPAPVEKPEREYVLPGEEEKPVPLTRAQRERVPDMMAAQLMDYFIETINDLTMLNPVRDGIPQCVNHPFNPPRTVGCIHSCAKRDPNLSLDVVRDYTLGDVFEWVKALVRKGAADAERNQKWHAPTDLTTVAR